MQAGSGNWRVGFALSLSTAMLWGLLPIALTIVLDAMDAWTITWWRFAVSCVSLGAILAWRGELPGRGAVRSGALLLALALVTLTANYVLYLVALDHTSPSVAQVVIQVAPLLLLLGGVFVFREHFAPAQWIGFAVLAAGFLMFFNRRLPELLVPGEGLGLGVLMMLGAAFSWAIYGLAQKALLPTLSSRQVLWLLYVGATILLLPFSHPAELRALDGQQFAMLAFCCANTVVAYGAFGEALHYWDVSRVSAVLSTAPLFTIGSMAAIQWIGWQPVPPEGLNALSIAGALAVVGGSMACALAARS